MRVRGCSQLLRFQYFVYDGVDDAHGGEGASDDGADACDEVVPAAPFRGNDDGHG